MSHKNVKNDFWNLNFQHFQRGNRRLNHDFVSRLVLEKSFCLQQTIVKLNDRSFVVTLKEVKKYFAHQRSRSLVE